MNKSDEISDAIEQGKDEEIMNIAYGLMGCDNLLKSRGESKSNDIHPNYYADTNGNHDLAWHEDQMFPKDWIVGNCVITALKYLKRFKNKNGAKDLKKCRTYIDRLIKLESK